MDIRVEKFVMSSSDDKIDYIVCLDEFDESSISKSLDMLVDLKKDIGMSHIIEFILVDKIVVTEQEFFEEAIKYPNLHNKILNCAKIYPSVSKYSYDYEEWFGLVLDRVLLYGEYPLSNRQSQFGNIRY